MWHCGLCLHRIICLAHPRNEVATGFLRIFACAEENCFHSTTKTDGHSGRALAAPCNCENSVPSRGQPRYILIILSNNYQYIIYVILSHLKSFYVLKSFYHLRSLLILVSFGERHALRILEIVRQNLKNAIVPPKLESPAEER